MADKPALGFTSLDHIHYLSDEIGPRPAGSEAENLALDYAFEQFTRYGYQAHWMDVPFAANPRIEPAYLLAGLFLAVCGWAWPIMPWLGLLTPVLLVMLPEMEKWKRNTSRRDQQSKNVYTLLDGKEEDPLVIFCAHVDSARGMTLDHPVWVQIYASGMRIMQRLAILICLLSIVFLLSFQIPVAIINAIQFVTVLVGILFLLAELVNQIFQNKYYTEGAMDNASGVGMVLALAEYFSETSPKRMQMGFLITGAEEPGLFGAEAFADFLDPKRKTLVINLDMIGAGRQLQVVTRVGSLISYATNGDVNNLIYQLSSQAKGVWYSLKSGDFEPFLKKGFDAVSIQTAGDTDADTAYHTIRDKSSLIDVQSLESVGSVIIQLIDILPYSDWAIKE